MAESSASDRVGVKAYVPQEQKRRWVEHADELGMSLSEYIRTMVQSGSKPFEVEESDPRHATPGGADIETVILDALERGPATWDDLRDAVFDDIDASLESALQELQQAGKVTHSGRAGGYVLRNIDD